MASTWRPALVRAPDLALLSTDDARVAVEVESPRRLSGIRRKHGGFPLRGAPVAPGWGHARPLPHTTRPEDEYLSVALA